MFNRQFVMLCLLPLLAAGCSVYVDNYHYSPSPGVSEIPSTQPTPVVPPPPSIATASASIVGVRWADDNEHLPRSVEVQFRLDNNSGQTITFNPQYMDLTASTFLRFPPPIVRPPNPVTIPAGSSVFLAAYFPFPDGHFYDNTDLQTLELGWLVQLPNQNVRQEIGFSRTYYYYYDDGPYWGDPYPYGWYGGVVVIRGGGRRWR